jgi:hypothetical protein
MYLRGINVSCTNEIEVGVRVVGFDQILNFPESDYRRAG